MNTNMKLGCGLIRIGRKWGKKVQTIPSEEESLSFLQFAFEQGVEAFDTAPAYGLSEYRLGQFLKNLTTQQRRKILILTKFGETFDIDTNISTVDHSYKALISSLDSSLAHLGVIDVLQIHKASVEVLQNAEVNNAIEYARSKDISLFGASISDVNTGLAACENSNIHFIQLPFNTENNTFLPVIELAKAYGKEVIINRPFNMGSLAQESDSQSKIEAFSHILQTKATGIILTGTASIPHLKENLDTFQFAATN